jgi:hypothetical protein
MAWRTAPTDSTCLPEMPRRTFLATVAGGLLATPLAAEAQQAEGCQWWVSSTAAWGLEL